MLRVIILLFLGILLPRNSYGGMAPVQLYYYPVNPVPQNQPIMMTPVQSRPYPAVAMSQMSSSIQESPQQPVQSPQIFPTPPPPVGTSTEAPAPQPLPPAPVQPKPPVPPGETGGGLVTMTGDTGNNGGNHNTGVKIGGIQNLGAANREVAKLLADRGNSGGDHQSQLEIGGITI